MGRITTSTGDVTRYCPYDGTPLVFSECVPFIECGCGNTFTLSDENNVVLLSDQIEDDDVSSS